MFQNLFIALFNSSVWETCSLAIRKTCVATCYVDVFTSFLQTFTANSKTEFAWNSRRFPLSKHVMQNKNQLDNFNAYVIFSTTFTFMYQTVKGIKKKSAIQWDLQKTY